MESLTATSPQLIDELRAEATLVDVSDVMMNSPWPQGCENSDGYAWALVLLGETVAKECCGAGPCTHGWKPLAAEDFSAQFLSTHKHLCLHKNWKFKHAKRILDVIMLQYLAYLACGCSLFLSQPSRVG